MVSVAPFLHVVFMNIANAATSVLSLSFHLRYSARHPWWSVIARGDWRHLPGHTIIKDTRDGGPFPACVDPRWLCYFHLSWLCSILYSLGFAQPLEFAEVLLSYKATHISLSLSFLNNLGRKSHVSNSLMEIPMWCY